jgi:hypothetical protein
MAAFETIWYAPNVPHLPPLTADYGAFNGRGRLLFSLLSYVLLVGSLDLHTSAAEHSPVWRSDDPISVDARHSNQTAHYEASRLEAWSRCPTCTLSSQTSAHLAESRGGTLEPPRIERRSIDPWFRTLGLQGLGRSTRAPPLP